MSQKAEGSEARWASVCETRVRGVFDAAFGHVTVHVAENVRPLGMNLMRRLSPGPWMLDVLEGADALERAALEAVRKAQAKRRASSDSDDAEEDADLAEDQGDATPERSDEEVDVATSASEETPSDAVWGLDPLNTIPSVRARRLAVARGCLSPETLEAWLEGELAWMEVSLGKRLGAEVAQARMREARAQLEPVRSRTVDMLLTGPWPVRVWTTPAPLGLAPSMWAGLALVAGERRRYRRRTLRFLERRVGGLLGVRGDVLGVSAWPLRRLAMAGLLSELGAAASATLAFNVVDLVGLYEDHLEEVEAMLLGGAEASAAGPRIAGLLEVVEALDEGAED